jgi:pimeloyl-ACP methyl ester carboxylesterase
MKRRSFIAHLSAGGASLAMSGGARAEHDRAKPTFVFVHGAWHGGWCWSEVIRLLAQQGYNGVTLDLPGHGLRAQFPNAYTATPQNIGGLNTEVSPLAAIRLIDYRDHVLSIIRGLTSNGDAPVILVGHSLGGVTLNAVAEAQPALIRRLVYLTALFPLRSRRCSTTCRSPISSRPNFRHCFLVTHPHWERHASTRTPLTRPISPASNRHSISTFRTVWLPQP